MSNCKNGFKLFLLLFAILILAPFKSYSYDLPKTFSDLSDAEVASRVDEGQKLFKANCAACHKVDAKLIGPPLANVWQQWETQDEIIQWVHNSQELIKSGNPTANKIFKEYNGSVMPAFAQLSEEQIESIIDYYVQAEQQGLLSGNAKAPAGGGEGGATTALAKPANNGWILYVVIAALAFMAIVLSSITSKLHTVVGDKIGEPVEKQPLIGKISKKKVISTVVILAVVFLGYNLVNGAIELGRSQGYQPEQPIKFSHALHAGQNKIDCQYCHSGADKSRHAMIPSIAVCMNCHKYVDSGPKYGKKEIAKIYKYSGWDPSQGMFTKEPKPIEWVKIHNLPDHVYFNHAQHVKVGGIKCQTCHGNVQEMEVVKQFAPLSMGWCINCHRNTDVQFANNDYYSIFEKYHDEIKKGERSGVTVKDIGGTECGKCHY